MTTERKEYTMEQSDMDTLMDASKPTRVMKIGSYIIPSPQENANRAWKSLGDKMGFDHFTVRPMGADQLKFTAVSK